jgi:hopene-associated glycosyltransferase HpnB
MITALLLSAAIAAGLAATVWVVLLLHPARPWDCRPAGEDEPIPALPAGRARPAVAAVVPARNEAESLPRTLPAHLAQDYAGPWRVIVVDDRSDDGTAEVAAGIGRGCGAGERLTVVRGGALPAGWVGKVWAMHQGVAAALSDPAVEFVLFTDADIHHEPGSLRRLVAESLTGARALNSRMARLHCESFAERLCIPAFVHFFNLLYPMRRVNDDGRRAAAAAGGCMLVSTEALRRLGGGLEPIRSAIIDDVALAAAVKGAGLPIRLALSRGEVRSLREYPRLGDIWKMVRRTAFTELRHSWLRLAGTVLALLLMYAVPTVGLIAGALGVALAEQPIDRAASWAALSAGATAWIATVIVYRPATRFFGLALRWALSLPIAALLFGLMTVDSALRYARGRGVSWREPPAGGGG